MSIPPHAHMNTVHSARPLLPDRSEQYSFHTSHQSVSVFLFPLVPCGYYPDAGFCMSPLKWLQRKCILSHKASSLSVSLSRSLIISFSSISLSVELPFSSLSRSLSLSISAQLSALFGIGADIGECVLLSVNPRGCGRACNSIQLSNKHKTTKRGIFPHLFVFSLPGVLCLAHVAAKMRKEKKRDHLRGSQRCFHVATGNDFHRE